MGQWLEHHRSSIFVTLLNIALAGMVVIFLRRPTPPPLEIITPEANLAQLPTEAALNPAPAIILPTDTPAPLRVYVSGAVATPDVYRLPPGSLVEDAVALAGGPLPEADLDLINLAQELKDQQQIYVPRQEEARPLPPISGGSERPANGSLALSASSPVMQLININTATLEELDALPRVGPAIAQRIIDHRENEGPFSSIEEIMNVRGIGQVTFEGLKDNITVGP